MISCEDVEKYLDHTFNVQKNTMEYREDIFILEEILHQFIPFVAEINLCLSCEHSNLSAKINLIKDITLYLSNLTRGKKKKNSYFMYDNGLKLEEKEFLYKTYLSSSDSNQGNLKFFYENTLRIHTITTQMVRSLLILLKEELSQSLEYYPHTANTPLLHKLSGVKKLIINENKAFDFKMLFILLNFIVLAFCGNLSEIIFEGNFYSRTDQIDIMIKNGVYLYFINRSNTITKFCLNNKIEFLNENVAFKMMHEYCMKMNLNDLNPERIEFNKINVLSILHFKSNLKRLNLKKITVDKISMIDMIVEIIKSNLKLKEIVIDKFISIPDIYRREIINGLCNLNLLQKMKINIVSSMIKDLDFVCLPVRNLNIKQFYLKLNRLSLGNFSTLTDYEETSPNHLNALFLLKQSNLDKLSLRFERLALNLPSDIINMLPSHVKEISIGMIDHVFLRQFRQLAENSDFILQLNSIKMIFIPTNDEYYEGAYNDILFLLENGRSIKNFHFANFVIKYKNIVDEEIKSILKKNTQLRKLIIRSELPFHVQYFEGFYYYEFPLFLVIPILFSFKKNRTTARIYYKKRIMNIIFEYHRIKKEKVVVISYKI